MKTLVPSWSNLCTSMSIVGTIDIAVFSRKMACFAPEIGKYCCKKTSSQEGLYEALFYRLPLNAHRAIHDVEAMVKIMTHKDMMPAWDTKIASALADWNSHQDHLKARADWEAARELINKTATAATTVPIQTTAAAAVGAVTIPVNASPITSSLEKARAEAEKAMDAQNGSILFNLTNAAKGYGRSNINMRTEL